MKKIIQISLSMFIAFSLLFTSVQLENTKKTHGSYDNIVHAKPKKGGSSTKKKLTPPVNPKTKGNFFGSGRKVEVTHTYTKKWITIKNGHLAGKRHPVTNVKFSKSGFPQFPAKAIITLPSKYWKSTNATQFKHSNLILAKNKNTLKKFNKADQNAIKKGENPNGYTWHHHEKRGVMELVRTKIHSKTGHTGGKSIWGTK